MAAAGPDDGGGALIKSPPTTTTTATAVGGETTTTATSSSSSSSISSLSSSHSSLRTINNKKKTSSISPAPPPSTPAEQDGAIFRLNDDCLESIVARLPDISSEVNLAASCKRFQALCVDKWRRSHEYDEFDLDTWQAILPNHQQLKIFSKLMTPYARCMLMRSCLCTLFNELNEMQIYVLPECTSFVYAPEDMECYPSDSDMRKLTHLLPNLQWLRITTPLRGRFLANFKHLRELYLYEDQHKPYELEQYYFEKICRRLTNLQILDIRLYENFSQLQLAPCLPALKQLAVLKLNLVVLKPVLQEVLDLPMLKQLVVLLDTEWHIPNEISIDSYDYKIYEMTEFYEIMERKAGRIIGFAVDGYYMALEEGWDNRLSIWQHCNLQSLAICSWKHSTRFLERYSCMVDLKLLCLRNWQYLCDEDLLQFVENCPKLHHIDVSYCRMLTPKFLDQALTILQERRPRPKKPLLLYYALCGFDDHIERQKLKFAPEYEGYIQFKDDFMPCSERGLSFVDRGYQFDFED